MIKNLVYKEFHLNVGPWYYSFFVLAFLILCPSWPFFVALAYLFMFFMVLSQGDKVNQDLGFASSLPVPKSAIATARTCTVVLVEAAQLVVAALAAVMRYVLYSRDNQAGMNTNLAFFGVVLVMYAVFNIIYLPGSYKKAYRMAWPLLGGSLISVVVGGVLTSVIAFQPDLATLFNDRGLSHLGPQATVFIAGLAVYAGLTLIARHKAISNFAKVDL